MLKEIKIKHLDEVIYYDKTEEGLPIYMWVNNKVNNFYITLNTKYGSIDTEFKLKGDKKYRKVPDGIAHFLEHVTFNEENGTSAFDYFRQFGSSINAFTSFDLTAYEVLGSSHFKENLEHLLDYVLTPCIKKAAVEKEKGIITEEISMGDNQPRRKMLFGVYEAIFHNNKRRISIAGNKESVESTTVDDLMLAYETFYHPKNMFVVITGNFNPYEASALIKENFSKKEFSEYKDPIRKKIKEPVEVFEKEKMITANIQIPKLEVVLKIERKMFKEKDDIKLQIYLRMILETNFGYTSDLREELMSKELVTSMSIASDIIDDYIIISASAETKYLVEITKIFKDKLSDLKISKDTLNRRKKSSIANMILAYDSIETINMEIEENIITYGRVLDDVYEIYKKVSLNELNDVISTINTDNISVVKLVPEEDK